VLRGGIWLELVCAMRSIAAERSSGSSAKHALRAAYAGVQTGKSCFGLTHAEVWLDKTSVPTLIICAVIALPRRRTDT